MAVTLLNCSICPAQPTFSDISHLLTHVSSKGHLSNLHKLQVRSHREITAGHQLGAYNQWYQQHDLGRLLSERMLQKESKKATTRRRIVTPPKKIKKEATLKIGIVASASRSLVVDPRLQQTPPARRARRSKVNVGRILQPTEDDDSNLDSSPVKQRTRRNATRHLFSSTKRSSSDAAFEIPSPKHRAEIDPAILGTPNNSKLKGVLWPGMHLFDAATVEMRRRRNQKKDGSALMQMEKTSRDVEPTEVIYSEGWTSIKERPITGLVEDSSPLKGESPLPKKPVRRKRLALAEVSANLPRNARRPPKLERSQATYRHHNLSSLMDQGFPSLPTSSNSTPYAAKSRYTPTEDETMEFKLTAGNLVNRKKGGNFTIFHYKEDADPHQLPNRTAGQRESTYSHFSPAQMQSYLPQARPQLPFTMPSWLQSQHQRAQTYQGLYLTTAGATNPGYYAHQYLGPSKENVDPWFARTNQVEQRPNPLGWNHNAALAQIPYQGHNNFGYDGQIGFSGLPLQGDVFGYVTNPLSAGYQNLQDRNESPFKTSESVNMPIKPFEAEKGNYSRDGTITEQSEHDDDQNAFTTSE